MLRIVPSTAADGAKRYFDEALSRGDYYLEGQELAGSWGGEAAAMLGLAGGVSREAFHQLCDNVNPATGKRLTSRTKDRRRVGYDFNFHCPKTVSAVYALTGDERILEAFRASVQKTMEELEHDTECRVRDKGQNGSRVTGNMLWGEFIHLTSRPVDGVPDPHLHAHCFAFNATFDVQLGQWKAADFGGIKRDGRYFEAAFHTRLARRLVAMGYDIVRDGRGYWDIAGIPETVTEKFSRRTALIEQLAQELGITDSERKAELGARSRSSKATGQTTAELRRLWDEWLTVQEREAIRAVRVDADGTAGSGPTITTEAALAYATGHLFERRSVVSTREVAEITLRRAVGTASVDDAWRCLHEAEGTGRLLTATLDARSMTTTPEVLKEEREMIAFALLGKGSECALGSPDYDFADPLFRDPTKDTGEQESAIRQALASHDRVIAIRGGAGTGKTTLMRELVTAIRAGGQDVFAFAPTAEASRGVLRQEGFAKADTVAQLLRDRDLQERLRGQVLWIDEAGLLGARMLNQVFKVAEAQGCRVILTGDTRQHGAVERGDAMRILERHRGITPIQINKIQRQRSQIRPEPAAVAAYRQAVRQLSEGRPEVGFDRLDAMGAVVEFDIDTSAVQRYRRVAADYLEAASQSNARGKPNAVLVVSPTHSEGNAVTRYIREGLREAGSLEGADRDLLQLASLNWTVAERQDPARYRAGQVIQLHQNVPGGLQAGQRFRVVGADADGVTVTEDGHAQRLLPWGAAERFSVYVQQSVPIAVGERIRITQNGFTADRKHRLNNGAVYDVEGFTPEGNLRLRNGWEIAAAFGHLAHGYVSTSHGSQGKTADVVLIAQGTQSLAASSLEQFYVSVSRGREQVRIYTDDREGLKEAIRRSTERVSATELARRAPEQEIQRRRDRCYRQVVGQRRGWIQQRMSHEHVDRR